MIEKKPIISLENTTAILKLINNANSIVADCDTPKDIIAECLKMICENLNWDIGHAYYVDKETLKPSGIWYQKGNLIDKDFYMVTQNTEFKLGEGLPGKILKHNSAFIENLSTTNNLTRAKKCINLTIESVMGCPIKPSHSSIYVLEFFSYQKVEQSENLTEVIDLLSSMISNAISKKEDEKLLAYSEKLNSAVIENSKDSIIVIDTKCIISQANSSTVETFGYTEDELIGSNINILMGEDHKHNHDGYIQKYLTTGVKGIIGKPRKLKAVTKDKQEVYIFLTVTEVKVGDNLYFVGTIRDITKLELITHKLQERTEDLEAMNKELEQFAYITSHDLKAPLRAIENLALWIKEDNEDKLDEESVHNLNLLCGRVDRMSNLIDGILEYSRTGRIELEESNVSVKELLDQINADITLSPTHIVRYPNIMPEFTTSKISLYQIFSNLISNAIKYHDKPNGKIEIDYHDNGDFYEFSVKDDGPGIDKDYQEKIFQIFQTLQSRDKIDSTGIGLTIVKKLVESQNGNISVTSETGNGTEFNFTWPKKINKGVSNEQTTD